MADLFGSTRTVLKGRYALLAPEGFAPSQLPGWQHVQAIVTISPAMGAGFMQLQAQLGRVGAGEGNTGPHELFIYVLEGGGHILMDLKRHRLEPGSFAYVPANCDLQLKSNGIGMSVLIFQKPYETMQGVERPRPLVGHEREAKGTPVAGQEGISVQTLLPAAVEFDLGISLVTCQPGAARPAVDSHLMEHGWLFLKGQGLVRLDQDYYPVKAGDTVWLAPYCPQWFVAIGHSPATYISYQNLNRDPLG